LAAAMSNPPAG